MSTLGQTQVQMGSNFFVLTTVNYDGGDQDDVFNIDLTAVTAVAIHLDGGTAPTSVTFDTADTTTMTKPVDLDGS